MRSSVVSLSAFLLAAAGSAPAWAQSPHWACTPSPETCQRQYDPNGAGYLIVDGAGLAAGSRICLKPGQYGTVSIRNLTGTAAQPIEVTNCGGQAVIGDPNGSTYGGITVTHSKHFRLVGTGSTDHVHGIKVDGAYVQGVAIGGGSTDFEVAWLEVARAYFAGIMAKSDPQCDGTYANGSFTQRNTHLHHNYVHHTLSGEAFYIGYFTGKPIQKTCGTPPNTYTVTLTPHELRGVRIHDNRVEHVAADGIQLGCAVEDVQVYRNFIDNYGVSPFEEKFHTNAVQIGDTTTGLWFDNTIQNGVGNAAIISGPNVRFYNNTAENTDGIYLHNAIPAGTEVAILNNTFVGTKDRGFERGPLVATPSLIKIQNNIMVHDPAVVPVPPGSGFDATHNLFTTGINVPRFCDGFHICADSPARNAGVNWNSYFTVDFEDDPRDDGMFDIGADEYRDDPPAFSQDFSSSASVSTYVNASSPSSGQFNDVGQEGSGGTWSIVDGRLQLMRTGVSGADAGAGLERWTDVAPGATTLTVRFHVGVSSWTNSPYQNNALCAEVGHYTAHIDYSSGGALTNVFASLCVDGKGPGLLAFETGGVSSANMAADGTMYPVVYLLNRSAASASYRGPDGTSRTLGPNRVAVWIGTAGPVEAAAANGSTSALSDFRLRWSSPDNGIWQVDNFVVTPGLPQ